MKLLVTDQMKFMSSNGFEVIMMSADGPEINEVIYREGCRHEIVPLTRKITPLKDLRALYILYLKFKEHKPQIVHTHTPKAGFIGMVASWLARIPVRVHTVAGLPLETTTGLKRTILSTVERITYFCATQVWPNSASLKSFISINKLTSDEKLMIIGEGSSNGIDCSEFNVESLKKEKILELKKSIDYDPKCRYILFVGRVVRDKGIEELIDSFLELQQEYDDLRLLIVGPFENSLDPLSHEKMNVINNNDNILAVGFSRDVKYYMHLVDLFVFPSHREGFPNVLMQAGLMECPIVASKINGNVDLIIDGKDGRLHKKGNASDLSAKIRFALNNSDKMNKMVRNLKEKIIVNFNRETIQQEILSNYHSLLRKHFKK